MFVIKIPEKQIKKYENGEELTKKECEELVNFYRHDFVTGLKGRHDFYYLLNNFFKEKKDFYLYLIDVKGLKKKNEISYHEGDKLLKKVAKGLLKYSKNSFRFRNGDEFAIIDEKDFNLHIDEIHWAKVFSKYYDNPDEMFKDCDQKLIKAKAEYYKNIKTDRRGKT